MAPEGQEPSPTLTYRDKNDVIGDMSDSEDNDENITDSFSLSRYI
jgi:hypothetical protein